MLKRFLITNRLYSSPQLFSIFQLIVTFTKNCLFVCWLICLWARVHKTTKQGCDMGQERTHSTFGWIRGQIQEIHSFIFFNVVRKEAFQHFHCYLRKNSWLVMKNIRKGLFKGLISFCVCEIWCSLAFANKQKYCLYRQSWMHTLICECVSTSESDHSETAQCWFKLIYDNYKETRSLSAHLQNKTQAVHFLVQGFIL